MKNKLIIGLWVLCCVFGCKVNSEKPEILFQVPDNFPQPSYDFQANPLTPAGVALGKELFYDGILSADGSVSCGSCHQQTACFTQHGHALSHGIDNHLTKRNSMPLQNLAWENSFMWDGGVIHLDLFPPAPIENVNEMAETLPHVLQKLRDSQKYPPMFEKAFGSREITTSHFLQALSQFMLTLVSANSKYDKYVRKESGITLTDEEMGGLQLFKQKCAACHAGELFTDHSFRNNGLPLQPVPDEGRSLITLNETDKYKFKVPSLRNVEVTRPYMHDGRFRTLEDVLEHYSTGVADIPNLDITLQKSDGTKGIILSETDKKQIIAFLKTLTDDEFLQNKRFSEY